MQAGWRPTLLKWTLLLTTFVGMWGVAEGVAWISGRGRENVPPAAGSDDPLYPAERDPVYGYQLTASADHRARKLQPDGAICYDTRYRTDRYRRRIVGAPERPGRPPLLLFGCSVTFGEGLKDIDTLQYLLADRLPDVEVLNYAAPGWGPTHALTKLRSGEVRREVGAEAGTALYVLIPAHVSRVIGDTRTYWLFDAPYFRLGPGGSVIGGLPLRQERPLLTRFDELLLDAKRHSWLLSALNAQWPLWQSDSDFELTAAVLAAARQSYREQFGGEFFVVLHPGWDLSVPGLDTLHDRMLDLLRQRGVPVLDYASPSVSPQAVINPDCDWHPNGKTNARLADRLADDLLEKTPQTTQPPPGVLVLDYHRILDGEGTPNSEKITLERFEQEMQELQRRGYRTLNLEQLGRVLDGRLAAAPKQVVIAFDDGWQSQGLALPILRRLGLHASFGIFPGKGVGWDNFEWAQIEALAADPLFEIFSHSMDHPWKERDNMVTWIDDQGDSNGLAKVDYELVESKRLLEQHTGKPVEYFAWPSGWYNERLIERATAAGYKGLLTIEPGTNTTGDDPRRIRRVMVDGRCSLDQFGDILEHHRYPDCGGEGVLEHRSTPYPP